MQAPLASVARLSKPCRGFKRARSPFRGKGAKSPLRVGVASDLPRIRRGRQSLKSGVERQKNVGLTVRLGGFVMECI